ncbi:MAG: hypothetical protein Q9168_002671 [Polycauliona sp. 1 TL-2023]
MPTTLTLSQLPAEFLKLQQYDMPNPGPREVLLRMLAAPYNLQDLMVLAGKNPVKPSHTQAGEAIPGYDGMAEITQLGENTSRLSVGQWVIPRQHGQGTWRSHALVHENNLIKVTTGMDVKLADL